MMKLAERMMKKGDAYGMRDSVRHWLGLWDGNGNHTRQRDVVLGEWKAVAHDLRVCADNGLCADCGQDTKWACDWDLMRKAADLIEMMAKEMRLDG